MWDGDSSARRELRQLDKLGLLDNGEILCEFEAAGIGTRPGALVVTDRRILFLHTGLVRRQTDVVEIPLHDVTQADASSERVLFKDCGIVEVRTSSSGSQGEKWRFEAIPGGLTRAAEITDTILRQRRFLDATPRSSKDEPR